MKGGGANNNYNYKKDLFLDFLYITKVKYRN